MTWAADGRATFEYGQEIRPGEPHIIWRRIGTHASSASREAQPERGSSFSLARGLVVASDMLWMVGYGVDGKRVHFPPFDATRDDSLAQPLREQVQSWQPRGWRSAAPVAFLRVCTC